MKEFETWLWRKNLSKATVATYSNAVRLFLDEGYKMTAEREETIFQNTPYTS